MSVDEVAEQRRLNLEQVRAHRSTLSGDELERNHLQNRNAMSNTRANLTKEELDVISQRNIKNYRRRMQENAAQSHLGDASVIEHNIDVLDISAPFLVDGP